VREVLDSEHEANGVEDVALAAAIEPRDGVEARVEAVERDALGVGLEALDDDLADVHGEVVARKGVAQTGEEQRALLRLSPVALFLSLAGFWVAASRAPISNHAPTRDALETGRGGAGRGERERRRRKAREPSSLFEISPTSLCPFERGRARGTREESVCVVFGKGW
jgi:hypothetical protein